MSRDLMHSDEIKALVRDAYRAVERGVPEITSRLYSPQELAGVPDSAVEMALGVANHLRFADIEPGETIPTSAAARGSTRSSPPNGQAPPAA